MKEKGHTVLPVFYDVDPSETYEKAFVEHEQNFKGLFMLLFFCDKKK
jgi:hypothetical protein